MGSRSTTPSSLAAACALALTLPPAFARAGDAPPDDGAASVAPAAPTSAGAAAAASTPSDEPGPAPAPAPPPEPVRPTTFRVTVGFPIFPVGVGVEQQLGPYVSAGADATVNFVLALHAHVRVYANPEGRGRFFVQPGFSHLLNPAVSNTSDMLEARIGVDVRTTRTSSFTVDVGAANATGSFASGVFPVGSIAWGTVFGDTRPE